MPPQWDRIRKLHVADEAVEGAIRDALADRPFRSLLDLGTGTGRMLELFGPEIERGLGIDLSLDMLLLARARLERAGLRHCSVRQGDIYDLAVPATPSTSSSSIRCCTSSTTARAPSARRRACSIRAAEAVAEDDDALRAGPSKCDCPARRASSSSATASAASD